MKGWQYQFCKLILCLNSEEEKGMNGKWKGILVLTFAGIMMAGCTLQGDAETQKTIIINEDVQLESSLADSKLEISQEKVKVEKNANYTNLRGNKLYFNENETTNVFDVATKENRKLADRSFYSISESGDRALSIDGEKIYAIDLHTGKEQLVGEGDESQYTFADHKGDDIVHIYGESDHMVELINLETNDVKSWDLRESFKLNDFSLMSVYKAKEGIYVLANSQDDGQGVYLVEDNGNVTPVVTMTENDSTFTDFYVLQNGSMIFNGMYKDKSGVFLLDQASSQIQQLVAGGKDEEGIWVPFYKLSPDESKILFDTPVQVEGGYKTNVYMAELINGKLVNTIRILENADLYAVISLTSSWSDDSKTAYVATSIDHSEAVDSIEVFHVK